VGTHRRIFFKDLSEYAKNRDARRRETLSNLFNEVHKAGLYDTDYTGD
jgi:hypothetical protein